MLTIKELKEFIEDIDDSVEVRISSVYDSEAEQSYHVETIDVTYSSDREGSYLVFEPKEIEFN